MPNMTLSLPEDLHDFVKAHQEINWSEVARQAMRTQAKKIELLESIMNESELQEKDIDEIDHIIKKAIRERTSH